MRLLLVVTLLIGGIAVAMPSIFTRYMQPHALAEVASAQPATDDAPQSEGDMQQPQQHQSEGAASQQVEIKAERDGHFYVDATINLRPVHLMVDTGATVVALRASDAVAVGIHVHDADYTDPVQTANGMTKAAEATLESVSVSDIEVHNIRALVVPDEQLAVSLLGGSFLHGLRRFEVENGTLIFEN